MTRNPLTIIAEITNYDLNEDGSTNRTGGHTVVVGDSTPAMYAMRNDFGVSVNETALCPECFHGDPDFKQWAYDAWKDAEDVTPATADAAYYPVDNPDAHCGGCGAHPGTM